MKAHLDELGPVEIRTAERGNPAKPPSNHCPAGNKRIVKTHMVPHSRARLVDRWSLDLSQILGGVIIVGMAVLAISAAAGSTHMPDSSDSSEAPTGTDRPAKEAAAREFVAILTGANEAPPNDSEGYGEAHFSVSDDESKLTFTLVFERLKHLPAGLHIHLGQPRAKGARVYDLAAHAGVRSYGFESPLAGTIPLKPQHLKELRAGNFLVDIHSALFFSSEISGQILAEEPCPQVDVEYDQGQNLGDRQDRPGKQDRNDGLTEQDGAVSQPICQ